MRTCAAGRKAKAAMSLTRARCHAAVSTCLSASAHHIDSHHAGVLLVIGWQLAARLVATCTPVWARQLWRRQRRRQPGSPGGAAGPCNRAAAASAGPAAFSQARRLTARYLQTSHRCSSGREGTACLRASHSHRLAEAKGMSIVKETRL